MKLKVNIFYNTLSQILTLIIPLITAPYISRVIGTEGAGIYSYSTSVASCFAIFILLGVANYGARTIAANRENIYQCKKYFWSIYSFQFFVGIFVILVYCGYVLLFGNEYTVALELQIFYLLSVLLDNSWYFIGTEQFKTVVTRGLFVRFAEVILIFLLVRTRADLYWYIGIMTGGTLIIKLWIWPIAIKQIGFYKAKMSEIVRHIRPMLILFIPVLATSVFTFMDKIMIQSIGHDINAVGIYEYSEKIVKLPLGIITAVGAVMLPRISNLLANKHDEKTKQYFDMTMKYLGLLVIAMAFGIAAIAPVFSVVFYGAEFYQCGPMITVLSAILITGAWADIIRTQYLIPSFNDKIYSIAVITGAIVNFMLNYIMIPKYGAFGAAIATIVAELALCAIHTAGVWNVLKVKKYILYWGEYAVIGAVMFIIVRIIGNMLGISIFTLLVQIVVGISVYAVLSILLLLVKKDEIFLRNKK